MKTPNILCFITDQHRADHLGCCGNSQVRTPNINRIASEGVTFTESYVANPVCMPNRASMFTGRYPKAHRVRENGNTLPPEEIVLPEVLASAGYDTASFGKIHLAPFGMTREKADHDWELYESVEYWNAGGELPLPFYGLRHVCLGDGHGSYHLGHYRRWLDKEHPGAFEKLQMKSAVEPPTGARESWKSAIPEELHYNTFIADRTIDHLRNRDRDKPFFVWCSFPDPHHPYSPPRPYCDMYDPNDIDFSPARREGEFDLLPPYFTECREGKRMTGGLRGPTNNITEEQYREIIAHTYGMISMVDKNVGRVMAALEEESLLEDTIVVFFSDHGDLMGDHWLINKGPFLFRGLVRVPTIWRIPGAHGGRTCSDMISTVDLMPTLLDLAGLEIPQGVQGQSYAGELTGQGGAKREYAYIEYDESYLGDRLRQLRNHDWALTFYANSDYGLLFDRNSDPDELYNLWDSPEHQSIKRDLLTELLRHTSRADDWLPPKKCHA